MVELKLIKTEVKFLAKVEKKSILVAGPDIVKLIAQQLNLKNLVNLVFWLNQKEYL